jgi:hypothetical protein
MYMTALLRNMTSRHIMRFQSVPNHLKTINVLVGQFNAQLRATRTRGESDSETDTDATAK